MFKKKTKKDQGVLILQDNQTNHHQNIDKTNIDSNPHSKQPNSTTHVQNHHQQNQKLAHSTLSLQAQYPPKLTQPYPLQNGNKRTKNIEQNYAEDASLLLENEPKKIIKTSLPTAKPKHLLSNNTYSRNQQIGEAVHKDFQQINYKAGQSLIKDLQLPADELEEELAKKRFLQNVETTKLIKEGKLNTKIYRGMNSYANHKLTNDQIEKAQQSYKKKMGPSRINSTIKNSCRFDYVLNLCKDWHDSGYCPFGNSCLYLHDRSNHKTGWELEKDFEQAERERWRRINNPELAKKQDQQKLLRTIEKYKPQEICNYCSKTLQKPVQVQCGHIFCTVCALKLIKCKECGKRLNGIMNEAKQRLEKQKKDYSDMVAKLQAGEEQVQTQRRKFQNTDSLDVFAD